jgi:hypothetical protein
MADEASFEQRRYAHEVARRAAERAHDHLIEHGNKLNEGAMKDAQAAIRIVLAINGGAAVAILAFIGGLKSRNDITITQLHPIANSLIYFISGTATAAIAAACAYLTNLGYARGALLKQPIWEHPYHLETRTSRRHVRVGRLCHALGVVMFVLAVVLFCWGMLRTTTAIQALM